MTGTFQLHPLVTLVDLATARAVIGRPGEDVLAMVEEGRWLRWAFDVSAGGGQIRCIRIWRGSLLAWQTKEQDSATLDQVIESVVCLKRPRLRTAELVVGWQMTRPHVLALVRSGELHGEVKNHTSWIDRASAVEFLRRRAVGAEPLKSVIGRRSLDTSRPALVAGRGQEPVCMALQEAFPPPGLETPNPLLKG